MTNATVSASEIINLLSNVRLIVVHGGKTAHSDEMRACAIARAFGVVTDIVRRDPTEGELNDNTILVMDVGGRHEPEKLNFDHHQRGRDEEPKCAYALLSESLGIADDMTALFPWYQDGIILDVQGPFNLAKAKGTTWDTLKGAVATPELAFVSQSWADNAQFRESYTASLGSTIKTMLDNWSNIDKYASMIESQGLSVGDFRNMPEEFRELQDPWIQKNHPRAVIFDDDRGEGYGILRINDDPGIDFAKCEGMEGVIFAHKGGFIVKTAAKDMKVVDACIRAALV